MDVQDLLEIQDQRVSQDLLVVRVKPDQLEQGQQEHMVLQVIQDKQDNVV